MSKTETQSDALRLADELMAPSMWPTDIRNRGAAELRRLDAEVRELKMTVQHESLCVEAAKERIEALDAENKALRADAERYRWLRRWKGQEHEPLFTVQHEIDGTLWGGDLDAAIDAARTGDAA